MAIYSAAASKAAPTTGTAIAMIRPATTADVDLLEIGVFNETAVSTSVGLIRSATTGTPSTSMLGQAHYPGGTVSACNFDTAWSAAPTIGSNYIRKIVLPATIGAGIIWSFAPNQLVAKNGATTQLILWNFGAGTGAALQVYATWNE